MADDGRSTPLSDADKLNAYLKLYERQMIHYERTQDIEWRISIGVWTLLAVAIGWAAQHASTPANAMTDSRIADVAFLVPFIHALWLWRVHASEGFDKRLWSRYRLAARTILLRPEAVPEDEKERARGFWDEVAWLGLEVGVTVLMTVVLRSFLFP